MKRKYNKVPITVTRADWKNEMQFESIYAFSKFIKVPYMNVVNYMHGKVRNEIIAQYKIFRDGQEVKPNFKLTDTHERRGCGVLCTTTGKRYKSILAAAKEINEVTSWTLGCKMQNNGKYIDKNGKEYIRLEPMSTSNPERYKMGGTQCNKNITKTEEVIATTPSVQTNTIVSKAVTKTTSELDTFKSLAKHLVETNAFNEAITLLQLAERFK